MAVPAHPGLYDVADGTTSGDDAVTLHGTRCGACAAVFFPPVGIGCPVCGSTQLESAPLAASGTLHSQATVHLHRGRGSDGIEAPFTVGEIALDDGPLLRALLTTDTLAIGDRVRAELVGVGNDDDDNEKVEPRFGPATSTSEGAS